MHHRFKQGGCLYRFEVPVCIALAVYIGQRRDYLSEKHPGLLLRQTVLGDDVIEQLSTWTVLKRCKDKTSDRPGQNGNALYWRMSVHPCLPPALWISWRSSLSLGTDDRHAGGSSSSLPRSQPAPWAGPPESRDQRPGTKEVRRQFITAILIHAWRLWSI